MRRKLFVFIISVLVLLSSCGKSSNTLNDAREEGYSSGFDAGSEYGFDQGFNMGYEEGYRAGYDKGYYDSDDELSLYTITGDFTFEAAEVIEEAFFQGDEYARTDEIDIEMAIEIVDCYKNNKPTEEGKRYSSKEYDEAVTALYDFAEFFYERMYY